MALTGLQVFKLLPNTNCRECGYPTCLAFAMKLVAGQEALKKCPYASDAVKAALGAASSPPIRRVTLGRGDRAVAVGEETVFFRHEKTFVHAPALFRLLDPEAMSAAEIEGCLDEWAALSIERAGETFRVDGVALREASSSPGKLAVVAGSAAKRGLPVALLAATPSGAAEILKGISAERPLLIPPPDADPAEYIRCAAQLQVPMVAFGSTLEELATRAEQTAKGGVQDVVLGPADGDAQELLANLARLRRAALDRVHPGVAYPVFLHVKSGEFEKAVLGIIKFASILIIEDQGGETWLPLWTLRQNIYTDPQKPLQVNPGIYPVGEPDQSAPLLVTTNFSLTYFIVSTELDGAGQPCRLAVVDSEGMSVLTAWSAGKFSGEKVANALLGMGVGEMVKHRTVIIPGCVAAISGELEDTLGNGWKVLVGPQEASDIGPFFRDVWGKMAAST
jgi:acetyl-CoA decarbonylase/synthase complex subunit gamma